MMESGKEVDAGEGGDLDRLVISSSLVRAYMVNLGKAALLVAGLVGAFYLVQYILGSNPFTGIFDAVGVPMVWVSRSIAGVLAVYLVAIIFNTLSLSSYEMVFEGKTLTYSYGSFFKTTKSTEIANIVRVNYEEYSPLSLGDVIVEFTGTREKELKVQFVPRAAEQCSLINRLMSFKKSQQVADINAGSQ